MTTLVLLEPTLGDVALGRMTVVPMSFVTTECALKMKAELPALLIMIAGLALNAKDLALGEHVPG